MNQSIVCSFLSLSIVYIVSCVILVPHELGVVCGNVFCVEVLLCVRLLSAMMFFLVFVYLTVHYLFLLGHGLLNGMCLSTVSIITSVSRSMHAISSCSSMISAGGGVQYSWYLSLLEHLPIHFHVYSSWFLLFYLYSCFNGSLYGNMVCFC